MKKLNHQNLVNFIEVLEEAKYTKKNGQSYNAMCIVLEYCANGELFDYVANSGKFSEDIARLYYHQLIEGLEYLHNNQKL